MVDMDMVKGRLRLPLMPSLAMEAMDTAAMEDLMVAMEAMADPIVDMDMARGRLRLLLMLSLAMEAMDTAAMEDLMAAMADPMGDMATESKVLLLLLFFQ